jgi:hypothetical protein
MTKPGTSPAPDWLVERVALDEVPAASKARLAEADDQLAARVAALRDDNVRELSAHPAGPAVALIAERVVAGRARRNRARRTRGVLLAVTSMAAFVLVAGVVIRRDAGVPGGGTRVAAIDEGTRVKGQLRLVAFRQVGDAAERLDDDALVRAGDVIQLRYNAGGQRYGLIASLDGAGAVTLHYPADEGAPPEATAVPSGTVALPHAYQLDDAPGFERFLFVTADAPIDVQASLAAVRELASHRDAADAELELPPGMHQASLRLKKPTDAPTPNEPSRGSP